MTDNIQAYIYRRRLFTPSGLTAYLGLEGGLLEGDLEDYLDGWANSIGVPREALTPGLSQEFPVPLTGPQMCALHYSPQGLPWPALDAPQGHAQADLENRIRTRLQAWRKRESARAARASRAARAARHAPCTSI